VSGGHLRGGVAGALAPNPDDARTERRGTSAGLIFRARAGGARYGECHADTYPGDGTRMTATLDRPATEAPANLVARLRATYASGRTRPQSWRSAQLERLRALLVDNETELATALHADLGKSPTEAYLTEVGFTIGEIDEASKHLSSWMKPQRVATPLTSKPGKAFVHREPLGVVLVIAPWNYPLQLLLAPVLAALAAGNCVVAKPSELAPATSAAIARLLPRYLDTDAVAVVEGGVTETTGLLAERWDHIFYTGNGSVGRVVMRAAAEHLTPVTLELGGKSPVIVAADADVAVAARRVAFGKFLNAGQTCIAPDHVFVAEKVHAAFTAGLAEAVREFYGADPAKAKDYGRIINDRHFARLAKLYDGGGYASTIVGGQRDEATRYFAPTVVDDVAADAPLMGEEIFGPILPVIPVPDVDAAMARINAGDKPLALYAFTRDDATAQHILQGTSSGGMLINHTLLHLTIPELPFGGVGESGMGGYHGKNGFDTFSHHRSVLQKPAGMDVKLMYPPYSKIKDALLRRFM
jgi:aldehyde dehydrogenase (NAD+)